MHGRVLDESGRPVPNALVEVWQANAGGRYRHKKDTYLGADRPELRRLRPDADRRERLLRLPHDQARALSRGGTGSTTGGPAHIHFSISGDGCVQRLITQMYFEGDPLIPHCPILGVDPRRGAIQRLIAPQDLNAFDPARQPRLQLRHRAARPARDAVREPPGGELSHGRSR